MEDSRQIKAAFSCGKALFFLIETSSFFFVFTCFNKGTFAILFALLLPTIAYPIAMIVIGAIYHDQCPIEKNIPKWLIVSGAVSIFVIIVLDIIILVLIRAGFEVFTDAFRNAKNYFRTWFTLYVIIVIIVIFTFLATLFLVCWFIAGKFFCVFL